jgi:hypothetical protein
MIETQTLKDHTPANTAACSHPAFLLLDNHGDEWCSHAAAAWASRTSRSDYARKCGPSDKRAGGRIPRQISEDGALFSYAMQSFKKLTGGVLG